MATSTPKKIDLAPHCHGDPSLQNERWKKINIQGGRRDYSYKP